MRLFVTGGTGFIGAHFINRVAHNAHEVYALRRADSRPRIALKREPNWITGSLTAPRRGWLDGMDAVVHFAAYGVAESQQDWSEAFRTNLVGTIMLFEAAIHAGIKTFVVCGSCFEYGSSAAHYKRIPVGAPLRPRGAYAASKAAASIGMLALAEEHQLRLTLLRPFHVYGAGEIEPRFFPSMCRAARAGFDFPMTAGEQIRDFVPVEDVADRFLQALDHPAQPGRPLVKNVGSGRPQTLLGFAEHWWSKLGATGKLLPGAVKYRPHEMMRCVPDLR